MGFRFHKSIQIIPGVRWNFSKSGTSFTLGKKGFNLNVGKKGTRTTVGLPGSGMSYSTTHKHGKAVSKTINGTTLFLLGLLGLAVVYIITNS